MARTYVKYTRDRLGTHAFNLNAIWIIFPVNGYVFSNMWIFAGVTVMLLIQMVFTYLPLMNRLFHSAAIGVDSWTRIILAGFAVYIIVEIEKKWRNNRKRQQH